jgi:hypothetical protein
VKPDLRACFPGAGAIDIKLLFSPSDGTILGMQAVGAVEGVEKRVDVVAMAMQKRGTVYDLEEAELCYAPQYGSAKDVINFAGMVAANALRGDMPVAGKFAGGEVKGRRRVRVVLSLCRMPF